MSELVAYPEDLRAMVDRHLAGLAFSRRTRTAGLERAMRYSLLAGGKRIRPVLALATARAIDRDPADFLAPAAALELVHTYSLIHDDLPAMDDDDLRRGMPTSHVRFGEDVAILAGDGLFAEAVRLMAEHPGDPARTLAALRELAVATGVDGMVGGQYVDVSQVDLDAAGLEELHGLKTGRLIGASVGVILELTGLEPERQAPFREFAGELGVLFQIVDDIIDVIGEVAETGKSSGSDERHGKLTYVSLFGMNRARELAGESRARAIDALERAGALEGDLGRMTEFIYSRHQ